MSDSGDEPQAKTPEQELARKEFTQLMRRLKFVALGRIVPTFCFDVSVANGCVLKFEDFNYLLHFSEVLQDLHSREMPVCGVQSAPFACGPGLVGEMSRVIRLRGRERSKDPEDEKYNIFSGAAWIACSAERVQQIIADCDILRENEKIIAAYAATISVNNPWLIQENHVMGHWHLPWTIPSFRP